MIKIEELLEAGVHFGHRVTKWNPRMAPYIFGERNKIHIIDVIQTLHYLTETSNFLKNWMKKASVDSGSFSSMAEPTAGEKGSRLTINPNSTILFVGTKKQAANSIERAAGKVIGSHYVNHRWLGGLLTNWTTMKICIDLLNSLESKFTRSEETDINEISSDSALNPQSGLNKTQSAPGNNIFSAERKMALPKKEQAVLKKQYQKLNTFFGGIKHMKGRPNLVFIVGQDSEMNAVRECQKLQENNSSSSGYNPALLDKTMSNLRTITILDTNCDPLLTDLFIPANDDSTKSIDLILNQLTNALIHPTLLD